MENNQYYDMDNNPVTLDKLCRTEPEWAANVIRQLRGERDVLKTIIKQALEVGHNDDCLFCGFKDKKLSTCPVLGNKETNNVTTR